MTIHVTEGEIFKSQCSIAIQPFTIKVTINSLHYQFYSSFMHESHLSFTFLICY
ncbi:hypothetical protein SLEP1_g2436 [Rubroshorea leprosula]|uniref:Uncharacterized protein n=1 Tax=Rubroshorea leprosula TaxID=152421 RepID=A0AAV5HT06_9ROSI|nr:hypothetical protein SLEP1_g2436 [Rubroshorea leprosula]